ncbi:hypothetical protein GCM10011519_10310 [Marmoricola endophyticus]|uniref:AMP-dependent synthetase/ligase domain-containing protein n=1 Tax=Marmoricola endophyticus TaxID=2040280 RepID=A0A917BH25_9ACTN|nr:AMP-binding protein [Marmoricola endophyticus]GGF38659.1 hypothetical protein GCM10011519_10310 [Marmoricola endophyticus]
MSQGASGDLTWFKRPGDDQPGTLNASYQLLDRAILDGRAEEEALPGTRAATLLERVGAFAGVLRGFALVPGDRVLLDLPDGEELAVALLAAVRLGVVAVLLPPGSPDLAAAVDSTEPGVVVTADDVAVGLALADAEHEPGAVVVLGQSAGVAVPWDVVMRAGRTDPAGCADLSPDAPALILWPGGGDERATVRLTGDLAARLAALGPAYDLGALLGAFRSA